jgi:Thymidylate kinase
MSKKPIIVFEGIEGSGKSYHLASVARYLKQKKIGFIKIRETWGQSKFRENQETNAK